MGISYKHFWSVHVVLSTETLEGAIETASKDHFTILGIRNSCNAYVSASGIFSSDQSLMSKLLLDSLKFLLNVPESNAAIC
jgi:hypothetical protein